MSGGGVCAITEQRGPGIARIENRDYPAEEVASDADPACQEVWLVTPVKRLSVGVEDVVRESFRLVEPTGELNPATSGV